MNIDTVHYLDKIRAIVQEWPETTAYTCYGTPAFKVGKKLLCRMKEDGATLALYTEERDKWMKKAPSIYFLTDHYRNYPMMLVNLARVPDHDLKTLLLTAWKLRATKKLLKAFEEGQ